MNQKEYDELKKLYRLPEFAAVEKDFTISEIEGHGIANIREKIADKIKTVTEIIECIMQPDTSLSMFFESRVFDEAGKREVFELYKSLMSIIRTSNMLFVMNEEQRDAEFVTATLREWQQLKPRILAVLTLLRQSWTMPPDSKDKLPYFG